MSTLRRKYTQEFKDSAVKLISEQGYQLSEASRNIGVNICVLRRWRDSVNSADKCKSASVKEDLHAELAWLRKENHRLKLEREVLKKSAVFFAIESVSVISSYIPRRRRIQYPLCVMFWMYVEADTMVGKDMRSLLGKENMNH
ncbi:MAG: transposase [Desulfuromonadales bacterium]